MAVSNISRKTYIYKTLIIVVFISRLSPVGVFFLVSAKILEMDRYDQVIGQLGLYFCTVLMGLFIHGFGTLSVIYFICTRTLPFRFIAGMGQVLATAFGTASRYVLYYNFITCLHSSIIITARHFHNMESVISGIHNRNNIYVSENSYPITNISLVLLSVNTFI